MVQKLWTIIVLIETDNAWKSSGIADQGRWVNMKFCAALEVHGARYDLLSDPAPYFLIVHYKTVRRKAR